MQIVIALLIFGFLILIHEFGHYLMARIFKVGINEFAIGMGPKLISRTAKKTGIRYSLRLLPIGGFVSMVGEDEESESENSLNKKPVWQRFLIMVAGSVMNLLLGFLLTAILVLMLPRLSGTTVAGFAENATSAEAGLQVGDTIVAIDGVKVHTGYDLSYVLLREGIEAIDITVLRGDERITIPNVSFPKIEDSGVTFGTPDFSVYAVEKTVGTVIKETFYRSITSVRMIWESIFDLISGRYGIEQMSGPVGITTEIGNAATAGDGGISLVSLSALIAVNLGVMNLLPLPALDGGRILFLLIEAIRRKPLKREVEGYIHFAGMALLLLLMLWITIMDVTKLVG
ncbi:MAG: site-2 protease family protein [Ruminococcaceae bacterium]|nr:site-2 protease family protein [Oscillospiraceae bacterium]